MGHGWRGSRVAWATGGGVRHGSGKKGGMGHVMVEAWAADGIFWVVTSDFVSFPFSISL
jgi:hypothetical protein